MVFLPIYGWKGNRTWPRNHSPVPAQRGTCPGFSLAARGEDAHKSCQVQRKITAQFIPWFPSMTLCKRLPLHLANSNLKTKGLSLTPSTTGFSSGQKAGLRGACHVQRPCNHLTDFGCPAQAFSPTPLSLEGNYLHYHLTPKS